MNSTDMALTTSLPIFSGNMTFRGTNTAFETYKKMKPICEGISFVLLTIAALGNSFTMGTILLDKQSRRFCSAYLFNICLADVLFSIANIAGEAIHASWDAQKRWDNRCVENGVLYMKFVTYTVSMFSLIALSVERFAAVSSPVAWMRRRSEFRKIKELTLAFIWFVGIVFPLPYAMCPNFQPRLKIPLNIALFVLLHVIPLCTIVVVTLKICQVLHNKVNENAADQRRAQRDRLVALLIVMVITFLVFFAPYHVMYVYMGFANPPITAQYLIGSRIATVATYIYPALTPIFYFAFCKNFRSGFSKVFWKCPSTQ